jgi:hypothetical protein
MMYLADQDPFIGLNGEPIQNPDSPELGLKDLLTLCVGNHVPQQGQMISTADWRSLNKIDMVFEAGSDEGWWAFEDADFAVLKKVVGWTCAMSLRRNSPLLEDHLATASNKKPESPAEPSENSHSEEAVPKQVEVAAE